MALAAKEKKSYTRTFGTRISEPHIPTYICSTRKPGIFIPDSRIYCTHIPDIRILSTRIPGNRIPGKPGACTPGTHIPGTPILETRIPDTNIPPEEMSEEAMCHGVPQAFLWELRTKCERAQRTEEKRLLVLASCICETPPLFCSQCFPYVYHQLQMADVSLFVFKL